MEIKLVSAIITTYKRPPELVCRAVKSALYQTYNNIEIIVVDDSSDSYSLRNAVEAAVRELSDDIIFVKHESHNGACAARNTGLAHAHGDYIAFLDDDDEWMPVKIEEQIRAISNDSVGLVYSNFIIIDEITNKKYVQYLDGNSGYILDLLLEKNIIGGTSNPMIKKECFDTIGCFDIEMQSSQDYDLWLRIAEKYPINYIDKPLLNYYIHSGERISIDLDKKIAGTERICDKYSSYLNDNNKAWAYKHRVLISLYVKKGWNKKALALWVRCLMKDPLSIISNTKSFLLVVFGYDSSLYKLYAAIRDAIINLSRRYNCE